MSADCRFSYVLPRPLNKLEACHRGGWTLAACNVFSIATPVVDRAVAADANSAASYHVLPVANVSGIQASLAAVASSGVGGPINMGGCMYVSCHVNCLSAGRGKQLTAALSLLQRSAGCGGQLLLHSVWMIIAAVVGSANVINFSWAFRESRVSAKIMSGLLQISELAVSST